MRTHRNPDAVLPGTLRQIAPFNRLQSEQLIVAAGRTTLSRFRDGEILLNIGDHRADDFFLIEGQVRLVDVDGGEKLIAAGSIDASAALAAGRPSLYEVRACGRVAVARMPRDEVVILREQFVDADDTDLAEFENTLSKTQALWLGIKQDIAADRMRLPSQPELAARLRYAVERTSCDNRQIAALIAADPAIAAKLLKIANSPLCRGENPITSLIEAVSRIGMHTVGELVICFSLKELFKCASPSLRRLFARRVGEAVRIGACAAVIAERYAPQLSDQALIAGLLSNVGAYPVLERLAEQEDMLGKTQEIEAASAAVVARVSELICQRWNLGQALIDAVTNAHRWSYVGPAEFTLAELVICGRYHAWLALGLEYRKLLPHPGKVPAMRILEPNKWPDDSLVIVREAKSRVDALVGAIS